MTFPYAKKTLGAVLALSACTEPQFEETGRQAPSSSSKREAGTDTYENIPDVSVSPGATLDMRRVAEGANCADIRDAWQ